MLHQMGGLLGGGGVRCSRSRSRIAPAIVIRCAARRATGSVCTATRSTASSIVFATATHPQVQDTAQGTAIALLLNCGPPLELPGREAPYVDVEFSADSWATPREIALDSFSGLLAQTTFVWHGWLLRSFGESEPDPRV